MAEKNKFIEINFKTRQRRNRKIETLIKEAIKRQRGEIKETDYLLPPGPKCLTEDDMECHIRTSLENEHPKLFECFKENHDHIFSCKRCRSLLSVVSIKLAKEDIKKL